MWLFTPNGFYSIVKKQGAWHVRARRKQDLTNLGLDPVKSHPGSDYPWRSLVKDPDTLRAIFERLADSIDYPNFKSRIAQTPDQKDRLDTYHIVWDLMQVCVLAVNGPKGGLKRGNTSMIIKECYDGRQHRSREEGPAQGAG